MYCIPIVNKYCIPICKQVLYENSYSTPSCLNHPHITIIQLNHPLTLVHYRNYSTERVVLTNTAFTSSMHALCLSQLFLSCRNFCNMLEEVL